ncbi:hypothetical protein F5Y10DRAFT_204483 [Nemania abortiva]|nr:hypothetical protein F5Y10DRAFT_204483 [Nemania abortiva]
MAADVTFSLEDTLVDDGSTDPDDYSLTSDDEDVHIGLSSRPQLPLILSSSSISKGLPSGLPRGIPPQGPGPLHNPPVHPHPRYNYYQHPLNHSPRPPPPPPLFPPPPLISPKPRNSPHPPDGQDRWRSSSADPQYSYDDTSHDDEPDSCFTSWQEGDGPDIESSEEADSARRLTEHYIQLANQRSSLSANFKNAQTQRDDVRKLRQSKNEADQEFMAAAQALLPDSTQLYQLRQLFTAMQNAHLEYQEAEQHLEQSMDELHRGQEDLESREEAFYNTAIGVLGPAPTDINNDRDSHANSSEDLTLRGITGDRPETFHPLYEQLRRAFGELQLARELLVNTRMKREALRARKTQPVSEDTLAVLENYGDAGKKKALELRATSLMTKDDIEQLQQYDELEQDASQDIEIYTEKVRILQQECRENGVLPSFSDFQQEGFGVDSYYWDEIRLAPSPFDSNDESASLAHPVFPVLLSNPTHLLHGFPQTAKQSLKLALQLPPHAPIRAKQMKEAAREANMHTLLSDAQSEEKNEYINRWLLHKLHHSAMEAELLWTTFRSRLKILDIDRWQHDVLYFWWRDEPANVAPVSTRDNGTDKASKNVGSRMESRTNSNTFRHSDPGQSNSRGLKDFWL